MPPGAEDDEEVSWGAAAAAGGRARMRVQAWEGVDQAELLEGYEG